jgi:hypothetical protein
LTVAATNGGYVDLSGLRTAEVVGGDNTDRLSFLAQNGGLLDLSNLRTVKQVNRQLALAAKIIEIRLLQRDVKDFA